MRTLKEFKHLKDELEHLCSMELLSPKGEVWLTNLEEWRPKAYPPDEGGKEGMRLEIDRFDKLIKEGFGGTSAQHHRDCIKWYFGDEWGEWKNKNIDMSNWED